MIFKILREFPSSETENAWRDGLARVECPSHYDAPEFFHEPFWEGKHAFAVLALEGKRVRGAITGIQRGNHITSGLPNRSQICVDATGDLSEIVETLLQGLLTVAENAELISVYTWPSLVLPSFSVHRFRTHQLPGNVVLDLTQGAEGLFRQFPKDKRRNIRFAEKNGVVVEEASTEDDIVEAYGVYSHWRETERKKVIGERLTFETFRKAMQLTKNRKLFLARFEGKVIAINVFRFYPGGLFESSSNSSLDEFMHLKPNDLLQWKGIEWACSNGLRRHSLGGTHPFLLRYGGSVVPMYHHRLDRTWLRRHDMRDSIRHLGVRAVNGLPSGLQNRIRRIVQSVR